MCVELLNIILFLTNFEVRNHFFSPNYRVGVLFGHSLCAEESLSETYIEITKRERIHLSNSWEVNF